jgi:hypothetical protein
MPLPLASNDTTNLQKFAKAKNDRPVTIEPLADFASAASPSSIKFGYYNPSSGARTQVMALTEAQSVNPTLTNGSIAFDPGSSSFGLWANAPAFGDTQFSYSEDAKNSWEPVVANRKKMLVYPLKDKGGSVVPNSYVIAFEEVTGSYDYQDFVAVIRNVRDPSGIVTPPSGTITSLSLINADTDTSIGAFTDGTTINRAALPPHLTVQANVSGTIGSIRWEIDNSTVRIESYAPYAIGGDVNSSDLQPYTFPVGTHTMKVTAYSDKDGLGSLLKTLTVTFSVI